MPSYVDTSSHSARVKQDTKHIGCDLPNVPDPHMEFHYSSTLRGGLHSSHIRELFDDLTAQARNSQWRGQVDSDIYRNIQY
eukprot:scaffold3297_cov143-Skeletonema_dohrnii-CCMP3373.AAC.2